MAWWETVDWADPLNRDWAINQNLKLWLAGNPNCVGGNRMPDIYGTANGTLSSGASWVGFATGSAVAFDGSTGAVSYPSSGTVANLQTGTIEFVARWTSSTQNGSFSVYGAVHGYQADGGFSNLICGLDAADPATAKLAFRPFTAAGAPITATTAVGLNRDRHCVFTWTSGAQSIYLDGVLDKTDVFTGSVANNTGWAGAVGQWKDVNSGTAYSKMTGQVSFFRLHSVQVSANDVRAMYSQYLQGWPDALNHDVPSMPYSMQAAGGVTAKVPYHHLLGSCL